MKKQMKRKKNLLMLLLSYKQSTLHRKKKGLRMVGKKMLDVIVKGALIARACSELEKEIYILHYGGKSNKAIASELSIPLESVTRYTEGGATR